jgi:hypothetical protein
MIAPKRWIFVGGAKSNNLICIHLVLPDPDHRKQTAEYFKNLPKDLWELFQSAMQLKKTAAMLPGTKEKT